MACQRFCRRVSLPLCINTTWVITAWILAGHTAGKGPRVCILGGGFGGLYTAIRLESLLWPPGSKPQVLLFCLRCRQPALQTPNCLVCVDLHLQGWSVQAGHAHSA